MSPNITHTTKASPVAAGTTTSDGFDLDVTLVEVGDVLGADPPRAPD